MYDVTVCKVNLMANLIMLHKYFLEVYTPVHNRSNPFHHCMNREVLGPCPERDIIEPVVIRVSPCFLLY